MSRLLSYHRGEGTDGRGRTLAQVQGFDHDQMESIHDFIQWMFPLRERSAYNPSAPVLTDADITRFQEDPALRENLRRSFVAFLGFLGLEFNPDAMAVVEARGGPGRHILARANHNWLRITRILLCLKTLGLDDEARAFFDYLSRVHAEGIGVDNDTFAYWRDAADGVTR